MTTTITTASSGPYYPAEQTTFAVGFQSESVTGIEVTLDGATVSPSLYTFNRDADGTGSVVFLSPVTGEVWVRSAPLFQQTANFVRSGPFFPDFINGPLDRLARGSIYLKDKVDVLEPQVSAAVADAVAAVQAAIDSAVFTITSATGQTVTTRTLLAGIASPTNGQIAYLTEAGREGAFRFSTADNSANVTADPYQGLYVAPTSDTDGSSGAWVRVREDSRLQASWYGIAPANSEATNTAIMDAIFAAQLPGNMAIDMPLGVIPIRVRVPALSTSYLNVVEIAGDIAPAMRFGTVTGYTVADDPVVLQSTTAAASGVSGGVIEVLPTAGPGLSSVHLILKRLAIRTFDNSTQNGVMAYYAKQIDWSELNISTGIWSTSVTLPTTIRYGARVPRYANDAHSSIRNVSINGFYYGMDVSEHVNGDNIHITACRVGMEFLQSSHGIRFGQVGIYRCITPIVIGAPVRFSIEQLKIELVNAASEPSHWGLSTYEVSDPANFGRGTIEYVTVLGTGTGAGDVPTFRISGGTNIRARRTGTVPLKDDVSARAVAQSIPNTTDTKILWDTEISYENALLNPNDKREIIFRKAGVFQIEVTVIFAGNATGQRRARLYADAGVVDMDTQNATGTLPTPLHLFGSAVSVTAPANGFVGVGTITGGTRLTVEVYQNSGGALDVAPLDGAVRITVKEIRS